MKKRISVIIPVYNAEKYIETAVATVISQPYENIDIVLINDGSKDDSPQICDRLAESNDRITVLHQENAGVSASRNRGINHVLEHNPHGYIMFLDADDGWAKNFFTSDIVELLEQEYDLIGFQDCRCNSEMNRRSSLTDLKEGVYQGGLKSVYISGSFCAMMYSCGFIMKNKMYFQNGLKYSEDKIFHMACMYLANRIVLKNKLLLFYRNTPTSAMKQFKSSNKEMFSQIINSYLNLDDRLLEFSSEIRGIFNEGKALAGIYVLDMIDGHFQSFGSKKDLIEFFNANKHMVELFEHPFIKNYKYQIPERTAEIKRNFKKYILKCRIKGVISCGVNTIYRIVYKTPLKRAIDKIRYPIIIE